MKGSDGRADDGSDGVVVAGVVDGAEDGRFGIFAVAHEDVEHAGHGFEQKGARVPGLAGVHGGKAALISGRDLLFDEIGQQRRLWQGPGNRAAPDALISLRKGMSEAVWGTVTARFGKD